jgi:hypothetical protein
MANFPNTTPEERCHQRMVVGFIMLALLIGFMLGFATCGAA